MNWPSVSRTAWLLAVMGAATLLVAAFWWVIVFGRVISNGYLPLGQSAICGVTTSIVCDLAMSLCGRDHPLGITWFSPLSTWLALGLLSASALLAPQKANRD